MNEKEMVSHIKALTKVIERQTEHTEQMHNIFTSLSRQVMNIFQRISRLEGYKDE